MRFLFYFILVKIYCKAVFIVLSIESKINKNYSHKNVSETLLRNIKNRTRFLFFDYKHKNAKSSETFLHSYVSHLKY